MILIYRSKLSTVFGLLADTAIFGSGIKQIDKHIIADHSRHVSFHFLLSLFDLNGLPEKR